MSNSTIDNQLSDEDLKSLIIEGTDYKTNFNKKFPPAKLWSRPDRKKVLAFIPGTIQKVLVIPGQQVNEGDTLIILEAMKMRNLVKSDINAKVKAVYVSEGERVSKNQMIIEFA
jgi:biotin carboxyl carrier protein